MAAMDNAHALVVGIANYENIPVLPPTVLADAQDVAALLADPQVGGYPAANVRLLRDGEATKAGLLAALADLAQASTPDATVLFYLSSHGGRIEDGPYAGEYLLPVDTDYSTDQAIAQTAIAGADFTKALAAIPARKLLVLMDCCHAGGIGQPKGVNAPTLKAGLPDSYYDALKSGKGRVILAAARADEFSWVLPNAANSLFTAQLLAGWRGGIASEDGVVRIFDVFEYVQPRVTADHSDQHPIFKAELEDNFPVALYLGGKKGAVPKDTQGYRYDAYVSYVDQEPDSTWVWDTLVPKLAAAGLRVAVSGDVEQPGVARIVGMERAITQAKRIIVVLSPGYMANHIADFENVMAQTMGVQEGQYRLLPVKIAAFSDALPVRLSMLTTLDVTNPARAARAYDRLVAALQGPVPD